MFDGAASFEGLSINHAVLPGVTLLNNLTNVLMRFRVGTFACMADLSKCFFQVSVPEAQRDLLRVVWYRGNNWRGVKLKSFALRDTCGNLTPARMLLYSPLNG